MIMALITKLSLFHFIFLLSFFFHAHSFVTATKNSYVVYLGAHSHATPRPSSIDYEKVTDSHVEFLGSFLGTKEEAKERIFYSYTKHINGFAAMLDEEGAMEMAEHPDVVSVFLNEPLELQTTRSWEFLGLEKNGEVPASSIWTKARYGDGVIIGGLDTGVWPESKSFDDEGMGPVPAKWRGKCQRGVRCNRKLIGARFYKKGFISGSGSGPSEDDFSSARDYNGHGTHTLSTAGGRFVSSSNIFGYANGTAKGGSPAARLASYKVCYRGCFGADILAAFDDAIEDGVDILSVSLGAPQAIPYFESPIAIGSFHAAYNNILVICSAGNEGPISGRVTNVAPWLVSVGASTMDRKITSEVVLGNGKLLAGESLSTKTLPPDSLFPLVYAPDVKKANETGTFAEFCFEGSLDEKKVKGKIVVCLTGAGNVRSGEVVGEAGGVGMVIIEGQATETKAEAHVLPATAISFQDGEILLRYIRQSNGLAKGSITEPATKLGTKPAPIMAGFSSRGPNHITHEILKPDITAPGVDVLAAYTGAKGPTTLTNDARRVAFNIISGTSMSCPHISGIAGLLKALHPEWSAPAIRSAMMTTAAAQDNTGKSIQNLTHYKDDPFGYGSGHVRPNRAMNPGLVYDLTPKDYLDFLCNVGYNKTQLKTFTSGSYSCDPKPWNLINFNYPSITIPNLSAGSETVTRTLKNVGSPGVYNARVQAPAGISVMVEPGSLRFEKIGEEKMFKVKVEVKKKKGSVNGGYVFGRLIWEDGKHFVRSPIVVKVT